MVGHSTLCCLVPVLGLQDRKGEETGKQAQLKVGQLKVDTPEEGGKGQTHND
jgi:hypothetical protein